MYFFKEFVYYQVQPLEEREHKVNYGDQKDHLCLSGLFSAVIINRRNPHSSIFY